MKSEQNYQSNALAAERRGTLLLVITEVVQGGQGFHSECRTAIMSRSIKAPLGTGKSHTESLTVSHK